MSLDRLPLQSHPLGRSMGEGVYVQRTDNLRMRSPFRFEFITTNAQVGERLTRDSLEESMHLMLWSLR